VLNELTKPIISFVYTHTVATIEVYCVCRFIFIPRGKHY